MGDCYWLILSFLAEKQVTVLSQVIAVNILFQILVHGLVDNQNILFAGLTFDDLQSGTGFQIFYVFHL